MPAKLGGVNKTKKYLKFFLQFFCPLDGFWSYLGAIVYLKGGAFDKKLRVLFGFVDGENLDFVLPEVV